MRSRVLFRSDRGHYRRREAPDPQRLQRGRGFVHVKARQAFPEIGRQVRRREQTAVRASRWRRRSCRALPDAPAPPKLRDRVRGWDVEFESGFSSAESATNLVAAGGVARGWDSEFESALLQRRVRCELDFSESFAAFRRCRSNQARTTRAGANRKPRWPRRDRDHAAVASRPRRRRTQRMDTARFRPSNRSRSAFRPRECDRDIVRFGMGLVVHVTTPFGVRRNTLRYSALRLVLW